MPKKTYIYFTPEELNKKFDDALVEIKKKVAVYKEKKKLGKLIHSTEKVTLFNV